MEEVLECLKQDLEEMGGYMITVKREDLELLIKAYEQIEKQSR